MVGRDTSPVTILGTGAMAMRFGAALARIGHRVTLVGTWPEGLAAIEEHGIAVDAGSTVWTVPASAAPLGDVLPPAPLVLVLVKAHQTRSVAPHAARLVAEEGLILTLQNGLGNREILVDATSEAQVAAGVTSEGATVLGPGYVRVAGAGTTTLGYAGPSADRVPRVTRRLSEAGFDVETTPDIDALLWRKLAVNCAINPLTALHSVPNGALLEERRLTDQMDAAAREVGLVALEAGVNLGVDPVMLAREVALRTAENRSSMLQDVERGGLTEIDAICGAVVRAGRHLDVETPVNLRLWRRVTALGGEVVDGAGNTLRQADFARQLGLGGAVEGGDEVGGANGRDGAAGFEEEPEEPTGAEAEESRSVEAERASGARDGGAAEDAGVRPPRALPPGRSA